MPDFAPSARPPRAAIAWATRDEIFCEIPCKDGPPYVVRYHKTAEGLAAALNIIVAAPETETRTVARSHPAIKYGTALQPTEDQRATAREILKKLGTI